MLNITNNVTNSTVVAINNSSHIGTGSPSIFVTGDLNGIISLCIAGFGMFLNLYVFIVMSVVHIAMHEAAAVLLKFQLIIDAISCLFLIIAQFQIPKDPSQRVLYYIVCAGFDRGMFMWYFYVASALNIAAICVQRFIITVYPFKKISRKNAYITAVLIFLFSAGHETFDYGLQMSINPDEDRCVFTYDSYVATWSWTIVYYIIPTLLLIVLYTKIILTLRQSAQVQSTKKDKNPEGKVLKNAVVVAVLFVLLGSPNAICSILLQYNKMNEVIWESFLRRFTYITIMLNSASTPVVYIIFLSAIREKSFQVICRCFVKPSTENSSSFASINTRQTVN